MKLGVGFLVASIASLSQPVLGRGNSWHSALYPPGISPMSNQRKPNQGDPVQNTTRANPTNLPLQETEQPDPLLQMSTGRMGAGGLTLIALIVALVLGVVFYGLNGGKIGDYAASRPAPASKAPAVGNASPATPGAPRANESGVKG